MAEGLSGQRVPEEYGQTQPFFQLAAVIAAGQMLLEQAFRGGSGPPLRRGLAPHGGGLHQRKPLAAKGGRRPAVRGFCRLGALLGAAYAFGSNVPGLARSQSRWLTRSGCFDTARACTRCAARSRDGWVRRPLAPSRPHASPSTSRYRAALACWRWGLLAAGNSCAWV